MRTILWVLFFIFLYVLHGQDVHFTQMERVPFYFNPAQTAFFKEKFRFSSNVRMQWSSVTVPFEQYLLGGEVNIKTSQQAKSKFGVGWMLLFEKAGDSKLSTLATGPSISYFSTLNPSNKAFLSIGVSGEYHRKSISIDQLQFDQQFNGVHFDPTISAGEVFPEFKLTYLSFGGGLSFLYYQSKDEFFQAGVGIKNMNNPHISWFGDEEVVLKTRYTLSVLYQQKTQSDFYVRYFLFYSRQSTQQEWLPGIMLSWNLTDKSGPYQFLSAGASWRVGDGLLFSTYYDFLQYRIGLSYDVNLSKLRKASYGRGGWELSFIYLHSPGKRARPGEIICPIF
ncbi:MAG: PorP/SprF family type IX secretion system membrane protein [Bacteroidales bacterium]|nr:PorP/SprF family type IX secretion system membrane protein [Bacteroidales bacterium]